MGAPLHLTLFRPLSAHVLFVAPVYKYVGSIHVSGDRLRLSTPDTEARQQKGEEGDATLDLVLKHSNATIVTYD